MRSLGLPASPSFQRPCRRRAPPCASLGGALDALLPGRRLARDELLALVADTPLSGVGSSQADFVHRAATKLSAFRSLGSLLGGWTLVYTTEKAVKSLCSLPGGVLGVTQELALEKEAVYVKNAVQWRLAGLRLEAEAAGTVAGQRVTYSFTSVSLSISAKASPLFTLSLAGPGGWSESIYADDFVRVVRNSRADLLIFVRGT